MATAAKTKAPKAKAEAPEVDPSLPPILELNTLTPKRGTVTIDDEVYEVKRLGDYGIADQHQVAADQREFDELWGSSPDILTEEQRNRMPLLLDRLSQKALDAPRDVVKKLDPEQKKLVVQVFTSASLQTLQRGVAQLVQELAKAEMARTGSTSET